MQFRAEDYYRAALERMRQAHRNYEDGDSFALTMYAAGLAVECLLRAFRWTEDTSFEGRHDLRELLKASRLIQIDDEYLRRRGKSDDQIVASGMALRVAMNEVIVLWHNNLRFASEKRLTAFLKGIDRVKGIKGDPRKKNAKDLLIAAQTVIDRGITLWTSKTGS
jgi:HEPN domain-containing protein